RYERWLDGALRMRGAIVIAAVLVTAAAPALYLFSSRELAPVEDQSHISLFYESAPDASLAAVERDTLELVDALTAYPETEFVWSLTQSWGGFGGIVLHDWTERSRSVEELFGEVYATTSQIPGLRVYPRLDPPLPTPGQYDVELVIASDEPIE